MKLKMLLFWACMIVFGLRSFGQISLHPKDTLLCPGIPYSISGNLAAQYGNYQNNTDDYFGDVIDLGFPFVFYGQVYTQCVISPNNFISFNLSKANLYSNYVYNSAYLNGDIDIAILFPFQDLDMSAGGNIRVQTLGNAPYRKFVVEFCKAPLYDCNATLITDQVILYETTNVIEMHIADKGVCPIWQNATAIQGLRYKQPNGVLIENFAPAPRNVINSAWSTTNDARRFTPDLNNNLNYVMSIIPFAPLPLLVNANPNAIQWFAEGNSIIPVGSGNSIDVISDPLNIHYYVAKVSGNICGSNALVTYFDTSWVHTGAVEINYSATTCSSSPFLFNGNLYDTSVLLSDGVTDTFQLPSGCDSIVHLILNVTPSVSGILDTAICSGQSVIFNGENYSTNIALNDNIKDTFTTIQGCDSIVSLKLSVNASTSSTEQMAICNSQLPITWNGINVTAGGANAATYTTQTIQGCDSTVILNLVVHPVVTSIDAQTICSSALPYLWNGISVSAGGVNAATFIGISSTGCDSMVTLNLTIKPIINTIDTVVKCSNALPFLWNGINVTVGGTNAATYTTQTIQGCDSIVILNLFVHPVMTSIDAQTICSSALPYLWNGISVPAGGVNAATFIGTSSTGCDSMVVLNLTVQPTLNTIDTVMKCSNTLPFLWNGINVTVGGTNAATYTTQTMQGCDSTVILNLVVHPVVTSIDAQTICTSALPYLWNGISVSAGGVNAATFTGISSTGCDSVVVLNLTVNQTLNTIDTVVKCSSALPFLWNGINVTAGGTNAATYTTQTMQGCDSIVILNLIVHPMVTSIDAHAICSSALPYLWNGISIPGAGVNVATFTGTSSTGCDSVVTLNLTVNQVIATSETISVCQAALPYLWNGINVATLGNNVAVYPTNSILGCDSIVTLNLLGIPSTTSTETITICSSALPYLWNGISLISGGTNIATFTGTASNGCDSVITLNLNVNQVVANTESITICETALPYLWNGISVAAGGSNAAIYTSSSITGCDSVTTLNLLVHPQEVFTEVIHICNSELPYSWNGMTINSGGLHISNYSTVSYLGCDSLTFLDLMVSYPTDSIQNLTVCWAQMPYLWNGIAVQAPGHPAAVFVTTNGNGCDSTVTLNLEVKQNIVSEDSVFICVGALPFLWNGISVSSLGNKVASFNTTNEFGCDSLVFLNLFNYPQIPVTLEYESGKDFCMGDIVRVTGFGADSYTWHVNDRSDLISGQSVDLHLPFRNNIIWMDAKDQWGCIQSISSEINATSCCDIFVPNAFSPNDDGNNDGFRAETIGNPYEYNLRIFNRFGQIVFSSFNISEKWDGRFNKQYVDGGVYYYLITGKCADGSPLFKKGDLMLIR